MYTRNYVQEGGGIQLGKSDRKERKAQEVDAVKWTDAEDIGIALAEKFPERRSADRPLHRPARAACSRSTASTTIRRRRTSRSSKPFRWRGTRNGRTPSERSGGTSGRACAATSFRSAPASSLTASAFLPWVIVGDVRGHRRPRHLGAVGRRPRRARRGPRDAQPDHAQELAASAARRRAVRARHHVSVVAHHAAHGRRARLTVSQAFAIVEDRPDGRPRLRAASPAAASTSGSPPRPCSSASA